MTVPVAPTDDARTLVEPVPASVPGLVDVRCWQASAPRRGARVVLAGALDGASASFAFRAPAAVIIAAILVVALVAWKG